jgi:hypothetical protein
LLNEREKLYHMIEPNWYALEWDLSCARTPEQVHKAFTIAAFTINPGPLAPLLRGSFEQATIETIKQTDKELAKAYERSQKAQDAYQAQLQASIDAERVAHSVTTDAKANIRQELQRRTANLVVVRDGIEAVEQLLREYKIWQKTRVRPGESSSEVTALNALLRKLERHRELDEPECAQLTSRLGSITPDARKIAAENSERQKSLLMSAEQEQKEAYQRDRGLAAKRKDQAAFVFRTEVLKFLRSKEYRLDPLTLANAIAGLPHIRARRSAQLCANKESPMTHSATYEIFQFAKHAWKRCRHRLNHSTCEKFKQAILRLPRFRIVEGHRRTNWLRVELAKDWYYLKAALNDPQLANLHPDAVPGFLVATFLRRRSSQESPVDAVKAESDRIRD